MEKGGPPDSSICMSIDYQQESCEDDLPHCQIEAMDWMVLVQGQIQAFWGAEFLLNDWEEGLF